MIFLYINIIQTIPVNSNKFPAVVIFATGNMLWRYTGYFTDSALCGESLVKNDGSVFNTEIALTIACLKRIIVGTMVLM